MTMNVIAVAEKPLALKELLWVIEQAEPEAFLKGFCSERDALSFAGETICHVAFINIEMPGMNGISFAEQIKDTNPDINIIFVAKDSSHAFEAISLRSSGYILRPVTVEKVKTEFLNLRNPVAQASPGKLQVQTFGDFEVFADGHPVRFRHGKTKELLAYLIDRRGAMCSNGELMGILWGDNADEEKKYSYLKKLRTDLISTISALGFDEIIIRQRGHMAILTEEIDCDYYIWLDGRASSANAYCGEYMSQFAWAEMTLSSINFSLL